MTNTCDIVNFLTERHYEALPDAQFLHGRYSAIRVRDDNIANNTMDDDPDEFLMYLTTRQIFEFTFNTMAHLCMVFVMAGLTYRCIKLKLQRTAMHAFLCTLGIFMLTEGVQVRYLSNPLLVFFSPETKTICHIFLQVTGGLLGLAGTAHKYMMKKIHFNTNHGKFGLVSLAFWGANVFVGIFTYYFESSLLGITHNIIGLFTFSFFMFSQWIGYESGFFRRNFDNPNSYKWFTGISLFLSVIAPVQLCVNKII